MTAPVSVKLLDPRAKLPAYGSVDAAGADLYVLSDGPVEIAPGQTVLIHTGLALAIPQGYAGLVCARSGLASKRGLAPANKVGVIDADYRGGVGADGGPAQPQRRPPSGGGRGADSSAGGDPLSDSPLHPCG